jgi:dATP pyrophosphohydrolase
MQGESSGTSAADLPKDACTGTGLHDGSDVRTNLFRTPAQGASRASEQRPAKIPESVLVVIHTPSPDIEVLVIERTDFPGFWQSVTGSKDRLDEAMDDVAIRELAEETGIVVGSERVPRSALRDWHHTITYDIYPVWRHRYAPGVTTNTEHWFSVEVPRDIAITLSPREHTAHAWLPLHDAAARCTSSSNAAAILALPHRLAGR